MPLSEQTDSKAMTTEIRLEIVGLMANQHIKGAYGLVLQEAGGNRRFSVLIGEAEAQSIALKLRNKSLPRPLTHELMANLLLTVQRDVKEDFIVCIINVNTISSWDFARIDAVATLALLGVFALLASSSNHRRVLASLLPVCTG